MTSFKRNKSSLINTHKTLSFVFDGKKYKGFEGCLLYTSPSPRDNKASRMPSSA